VSGAEVTGRAYLKDGGYDDQVYREGRARAVGVKSSTHVAAEAR